MLEARKRKKGFNYLVEKESELTSSRRCSDDTAQDSLTSLIVALLLPMHRGAELFMSRLRSMT